MTDRAITDLDVDLQPIAREVLAQGNSALKAYGSTVGLIVTWRSGADQNTAKAKGLSNDAAGDSPHNCVDDKGNPASCAFDFGIFESDGKYVANGQDERYTIIGKIGESLGLIWGGAWVNFKDFDHLQLANWDN